VIWAVGTVANRVSGIPEKSIARGNPSNFNDPVILRRQKDLAITQTPSALRRSS